MDWEGIVSRALSESVGGIQCDDLCSPSCLLLLRDSRAAFMPRTSPRHRCRDDGSAARRLRAAVQDGPACRERRQGSPADIVYDICKDTGIDSHAGPGQSLEVSLTDAPFCRDYRWDLPPRVAPPRRSADKPMTGGRVGLGRRLFYDARLSGTGTQSCATGHVQSLAFTDGRAHGLGR